MKIEIKCADEKLVLTNEQLDNSNFVDIYMEPLEGDNDINGMTVPIDELYSAITAFKTLKNELSKLSQEK